MLELLDFSITGVNIIPTVLLIFVLIYWIIVIIGVIDVETVDVDLDLDHDLELDFHTDAEVHAAADAHVGVGGFASVLSFFNIGHMPLMVFLSFFTLPLWASTLLINDFWGITNFFTGLLVFFPTFIGCLFVAKFLTIPVAKFYRKIRHENEAIKHIVGQLCMAKLPISEEQISQAEIKVNGTSVLINAKTRHGETIAKGAQGLVIEEDAAGKFYYVEPYY